MNREIDVNNPAPLYKQLADKITGKIESGELKSGDQIPSQHDLIKNYNVSMITVKKALSILIQEGVLFTRLGKGTYVSEPPKSISGLSENKTIGVVLRDLKHPFFSLVLHGIEEKVNELGYNLLLSSSSNDAEKEEAQINRFIKSGVDGLIIASLALQYRATETIQKLHRQNKPYVMVSYIHEPDYWYVGLDQEYGAYLGAEHLIKLGYRNIRYLHSGHGNLLCEVRKNAFYRALNDYDIPYGKDTVIYIPDEIIKYHKNRYDQGYEVGKQFVANKEKADAIYAYSDLLALGFEQALLDSGLHVPGDMAIMGFDDIDMSQYASVPLTTIHQPAEKIGRVAVEIIKKRLNGESIPNRTIFKPSLIVRESCGAKKAVVGENSKVI
jgi:DNA-binding LacI/PurR family transcriptional regulator